MWVIPNADAVQHHRDSALVGVRSREHEGSDLNHQSVSGGCIFCLLDEAVQAGSWQLLFSLYQWFSTFLPDSVTL